MSVRQQTLPGFEKPPKKTKAIPSGHVRGFHDSVPKPEERGPFEPIGQEYKDLAAIQLPLARKALQGAIEARLARDAAAQDANLAPAVPPPPIPAKSDAAEHHAAIVAAREHSGEEGIGYDVINGPSGWAAQPSNAKNSL